MYRRLDPFGNPNVGVYVLVTSKHLFVPNGLTDHNLQDLQEAFKLEPVVTSVSGSPLLGSLVAANAHGAILPDFASDADVQVFQDAGLETMRLGHARLNAAGNNILCNDHGAIIHPDLGDGVLDGVSHVLGVDVERGRFGGLSTVGSAAVATNQGVLCHPLTTDEERNFIKGALHAPARIGTVNHGHGLIGAGLAANQHGAACGSRTTGIELGRIEEALGFLE